MIMRLQKAEKTYCCTLAIIMITVGFFVCAPVFASPSPGSLRAQRSNLISAGILSLTPEKIQSQFSLTSQDDYDARDEYNRPVKKASASRRLQNLFIAGFYDLLSKSEIFSIAKAQEFLNKNVNPSLLAFARTVWQAAQRFIAIIISQTKRQSILMLLPFILITLAAISSFHFSYLIFTPKSRVAPLVLRC